MQNGGSGLSRGEGCFSEPPASRVSGAGLLAAFWAAVLPVLAALALAVPAHAQTPATGQPSILGTARVGETLTASTSGIMDADGLTNVTYSYQWIRVDGGTETAISGATASTYIAQRADMSKQLKVEVSFTDDAGNAEMLTSDAYPTSGTVEPQEGDIRLVGGSGPHEGRVEIYHYSGDDSGWGTVCNDGWTAYESRVACLQLGYSGGDPSMTFGQGSGRIWLDNVTCSDADLMACTNGDACIATLCSHEDWGDNNCGHHEDVGVVCTTDDTPQVAVSFVSGSSTAAEGGPKATVTVQLDQDPERTVEIWLVATPQGGAAAADYSGVPSRVTFTAGETMKEITVTATDDTFNDDGESVQLGFGRFSPLPANTPSFDRNQISPLLPAKVGTGSPVTVDVALTDNDDPQVRVSFVQARYTAAEGGLAATVTVRLDRDPERTVTIPLVATPQGGAAAADYALPSSVTFTAGETMKEITVTAPDDAIDDDGEAVQLGFGSPLPDRVTTGSPATVTVAIFDNDDPQVRVSFAQTRYTATEGGTAAMVTVTLDTDPERAVTIPLVATPQGGATAGDYTGVPSSVTFTSGSTPAQTFPVRATDDAIDDDGEAVQLGFGSPLPDRVTAGSAATVTVTDNDARGVQVSKTTLNVPEGASTTYTLVLTSEPTAAVTVTVTGATGDVRVTGAPGPFTPTTWNQPQTITVDADDDTDAVADPPVTLRHTVSGGDYGAMAVDDVRVTIIEKDAPTLTLEPAQAAESAGEMVFAVELSVASSEAVTVDYATAAGTATAGQDYESQSGTLTFPPQSTTPQMIRVPLLNDEIDEAEAETVTIRLRNAQHATLAGGGTTLDATGTITDDDDPVVAVSFKAASYPVSEGKAVEVTVRLSADPERQVEIPLTRTPGDNVESSDYSGVPDTLVFESGDRERTFSFIALADQEDEAAETVTFAFGVPLPPGVEAGSPTTTVVTIVALSPPPPPPPPPGGGGGGGPACAEDVHGNSAAQASDIALATATAGAICPAADVDYFTVTAPGRGLLFVDTPRGISTQGTLWQDTVVLATGPTSGREQDARLGALVQAGPVVVAVHGQGGATGPYAVEITFVQGYLENPGPESFQSGVGVLSGWVCEAAGVEIEIGNTGRQVASYGTERLDTARVCGDTDNGFGLLFNWNLLRDGEHDVVAYVDDVELGRATVRVTTLGVEFLRDVAGECTVADFPTLGERVTLMWQQNSQNFVIVGGSPPAGATPGRASGLTGFLENPGHNSFQNGVRVLSGWVCDADTVELAIGTTGRQPAAYGTERLDTEPVCGDTDNGFGLLFNWNLLGDGEHTVVAWVDDVELGRATVRVTTLGHEFLRGVEGECTVEDFPAMGQTVLLEWQQTSQNFVITDVE